MLKKPEIKAVSFDMDGLMFNTEDVYFHVGKCLMQRRGYEYTQELCAAIMGTAPQRSFETMIKWYNLPDRWEDLHKESETTFFELLDKYLAPMPGALKLVMALEKAGIPRSICTSSSRRVMEGVTARYDLERHFTFTLTAGDITAGKPDPQIYLLAAEKFGIHPENMMVLEDSENGCKSGSSAGAYVVAVPGDHSRHMNFSSASLVISSLSDSRLWHLLGLELDH